MEKNLEAFVRENNKIANDIVEKYLEPFLLSLGDDPGFFEEIKKKHLLREQNVSF